jgi:hypothetical protein
VAWRILICVLIVACGIAGCDDDDDDDRPSNAPADHTVSEDGVRHLPGLRDPENNCTGCHGTDLRGGEGPSCYSCHGKEW